MEQDGRGGMRPTGRFLSAIDRLYARFDGMYLDKWKRNFTSPAAVEGWKEAWSDSLARNNVTPQMAFEALHKCEREHPTWPPTVGEFLALCKPQLDYEDAFHYAARHMHKRLMNNPADLDQWPVPAVYWAAVDFGQYELQHANYQQAAAKWKRLLDKRLESGCPAVERYVPQLAAPARDADGKAMTSMEARAAAMSATRAMSGKKPSRYIAIERARDVLARHAAGETINVYFVEYAKDVLARLEPNEPDELADDQP